MAYGRKRQGKRMPSKARVLAAKPKRAVALIEKQVQVLMKRTAAQKPETKYLDQQISINFCLFGVDAPFVAPVAYPVIGTGQGNRISDKISSVTLHCKGQIRTQSLNITGGYVWLMVCTNKLNTGSGAFSIASIYKPDVLGFSNPLCHRDHENRKDWRILKTVKLWIDHDGVLGNSTTGYQNAAKSFDFSVKLPSIMYDGASIIGNACQVIAYCNQGANGTFLLGKGYEILLNNRLTYTDA
jgi:hypothetical protein